MTFNHQADAHKRACTIPVVEGYTQGVSLCRFYRYCGNSAVLMGRVTDSFSVPPTLHLMRHGQGYHAILPERQGVRDPELTPHGEEQCRQRCQAFSRHQHIDRLFASPLRRTLQTCQIAFAPCLERGLQITALPLAVEVQDDPADTGSPVSTLKEQFPAIDMSELLPEWYRHIGELSPEPAMVTARAKHLRLWLRDLPNQEIVLVAHGMFNHYLLGEVDANGKQTTPWWTEAELRTYEFVEDEEANLRETEESRQQRGEAGGA